MNSAITLLTLSATTHTFINLIFVSVHKTLIIPGTLAIHWPVGVNSLIKMKVGLDSLLWSV